jgi:hypothetical protein
MVLVRPVGQDGQSRSVLLVRYAPIDAAVLHITDPRTAEPGQDVALLIEVAVYGAAQCRVLPGWAALKVAIGCLARRRSVDVRPFRGPWSHRMRMVTSL